MRDVEPPAPEDGHDAVGGLEVAPGVEEGVEVEGEDADVESAELVEEVGTVESGGDDDGLEAVAVEVAKEKLENARGPASSLADDVEYADLARRPGAGEVGLFSTQSDEGDAREELEHFLGHGMDSGPMDRRSSYKLWTARANLCAEKSAWTRARAASPMRRARSGAVRSLAREAARASGVSGS
jgi:hypothetical protein